jgi:hypothetical protein
MVRSPFLIILFLILSVPAAAAETSIGTVNRIQAQVDAIRAADVLRLEAFSSLQAADILRSGKDARLEAVLIDGTKLTLGETAELKLDSYVYDPAHATRNRLIAKVKGAFLFVGGKVEGSDSEVTIVTGNAVMGVRGTTFWGGPIDNAYGVLALSGVVTVTTEAGTVTLTDGQGTMIASAGAPPDQPKIWPSAKRSRVIATVTFQ